MNTNRRKFFGLMGGAAVAGPAVAKEVVSKLPSGMGDLSMGRPLRGLHEVMSAKTAQGIGDGDWRLRQIADLKRLIAGDLTEEEKEDQRRARIEARQALVSQHVACLGSVSSVRKLDIYNDRLAALNDEINQARRQGYLSRLLREAGQ